MTYFSFREILKNVCKKLVSTSLIVATLLCCIHINNEVRSREEVVSGFNMMACTGAISWPAFAFTAIPIVVMAIIPGSKGVKVAQELTKGGQVAENIAKAVSLAGEKLGNPNPVELVWTVIDVIVAFTPGGAGMKMAKLVLEAPKLITAL